MQIKGRGTGTNPNNRFNSNSLEPDVFSDILDENENILKTQFIPTHPKTILNKIVSEDIPFSYSLNPYQGCEHGCIYCYARPSHNYWGYSSGLDFEQKILVKQNVIGLLTQQLQNVKWKAVPIALSGNTDCYQPAEAKFKITRAILETMYKFRHPVSIITKNQLILRDLDILKKLNEHNLISVAISITTLDKNLQRILEPRTATPDNRFKILRILKENGIPTICMMAPIIPGLTDHEIINIAKKSAKYGANALGYSLIRLNQDLDILFSDWLDHHMPAKKDKIINQIKSIRNGKLSATISENRMKGQGKISEIIAEQIKLARKLYFPENKKIILNTELHKDYKSDQLSLF